MIEILKSTITGNVVGLLSLLAGIVGIFITIKTMKTAKRIETDIKEAKIVALDKKRFNSNKEAYLKKLNSQRKAVSKHEVLSYSLCNDVLSIINDLKGYSNIITEIDMDIIEQQRNKLQRISSISKYEETVSKSLQEFDVVIATIINILCKGEYDL